MVAFAIAFILIIITFFVQDNLSVLYAGLFALMVCFVSALSSSRRERKNALNLTGLVFCIYWFSATIISISFENGQSFYVIDPAGYYANYKSIHSFQINEYFDNLTYLYVAFSDNNALYNSIMEWLAYKGNSISNGANMMYYTSFHLMFGVLCSLAAFKILCSVENGKKAFRHTLIFSFISLFHIYSCVCLRDIWIAAAFLWAIVIVKGQFNIKGLLGLIVLFLFTAGIRIYSGIFFLIFIAYYLYKKASVSHLKLAYYSAMAILGLIALSSAVGSLLVEQTIGEVGNVYDEQMDRGITGLSAYIYNLPHGFREIVMIFYSQIMPFPSFMYYNDATTFSHYYISSLVLIFPLINFFSFYGFLYILMTKKNIRKLDVDDWALIIIALLFAVANSSQMDVRRVMPSFFIFYYCSIKVFILNPRLNKQRINSLLTVGYCGLLLIYAFIKLR